MKIKKKLTLLLVAVILLPIIGISIFNYQYNKGKLTLSLRNQLLEMATAFSKTISGEDVRGVLEGTKDSPRYLDLKMKLRGFIGMDEEKISEAYILVPTDDPNLMSFVADGQPNESEAAGFLEGYDVSKMPALKEAINGPSADKEVSSDKWGTWLSGYAPIRDNKGVPVAILGLDMKASDIDQLKMEMIRLSVFYVIFGLLVAFLVGWFGAHAMSRTILKLVKGIKEISEGKFGHQIGIKRKDEIGELVGIFNKMSYKLNEVDKMKLDFLSIVSHELYTPITPVTTGIDILNELPNLSESHKKLLKAMEREMKKLRGLIDDVMDFSWLDTSKTMLDKAPTDLEEVANDALIDVAEASRLKEIEIAKDCEPGLPKIMADKKHLRHVVKILLDNALKFSQAKGSVSLSIKRGRDKDIVISVTDKGAGLEQEHLGKIFEGFRQVEDPLVRTHGGLGLGLAMAKRFIELHGGKISVSSKGLGEGSTFTVTIPVV